MTKQFGLGRAEKLKSRKSIDALFRSGSSLAHFPLRLKYRLGPAAEGVAPIQMGVTVSKKHFKRAVDRNRIKRLVREAYRLQKAPLLAAAQAVGKGGALFFIYTDKQLHEYAVVYSAVTKCLEGLLQKEFKKHENAG